MVRSYIHFSEKQWRLLEIALQKGKKECWWRPSLPLLQVRVKVEDTEDPRSVSSAHEYLRWIQTSFSRSHTLLWTGSMHNPASTPGAVILNRNERSNLQCQRDHNIKQLLVSLLTGRFLLPRIYQKILNTQNSPAKHGCNLFPTSWWYFSTNSFVIIALVAAVAVQFSPNSRLTQVTVGSPHLGSRKSPRMLWSECHTRSSVGFRLQMNLQLCLMQDKRL